MLKSRRSKKCDISQKVKKEVWERDKYCIYCGSVVASPSCHFISRAKGGLGIPKNIVTMCFNCHYNYDMTDMRQHYKEYIRNYLMSKYPDWNEEDLIYRK